MRRTSPGPRQTVWRRGGISGTFSYDGVSKNLLLSGSDTAYLSSGVYFFNDLILEQSASLQLLPGAEVEIYVTGSIYMRNASSMNSDGKPADLMLYSSGNILSLEQGATMTAVVIALNVDFTLANAGDFYGSLLANSIHLANNPNFHYDRSLASLSFGTTSGYRLIAWRELDWL